MREIKFRGFSINKKKWVYGNYNYTFERGYLSQGYDDVPPRCYYIDTETNYYEVYSRSIGQYTGFKDKNGKEIYEGDILGVSGSNEYAYIIEWNHNNGCFTSIDGGIDNFIGDIDDEINFNLLSNMRLDLSVVIGNIHDNPELLEVV